jgi:hypothetical protein
MAAAAAPVGEAAAAEGASSYALAAPPPPRAGPTKAGRGASENMSTGGSGSDVWWGVLSAEGEAEAAAIRAARAAAARSTAR